MRTTVAAMLTVLVAIVGGAVVEAAAGGGWMIAWIVLVFAVGPAISTRNVRPSDTVRHRGP